MSAVALHARTARASASVPGILQPVRDWLASTLRLLQSEEVLVRVVLVAVRGSAPREPGVCLLVTRERTLGTIGGGALEWEAVRTARVLLGAGGAAVLTQKIVLG